MLQLELPKNWPGYELSKLKKSKFWVRPFSFKQIFDFLMFINLFVSLIELNNIR